MKPHTHVSARRAHRSMTALCVGLLAASALAQTAVAPDTCDPLSLLDRNWLLDQASRDTVAAQPWLKNALTLCVGLASGTAPAQQGSIAACLAKACTSASPSCASSAERVLADAAANAGLRARWTSDLQRCTPGVAARLLPRASRTPLQTLAAFDLASYLGNEPVLRSISVGSVQDFQSVQRQMALLTQMRRFFEASAQRFGPLATELAHLQLAADTGRRVPRPTTLRERTVGDTVVINDPVGGATSALFRRVDGEWKRDASDMAARAGEGDRILPVLAAGFERVTRLMGEGRVANPAIGINAVGQCGTLGLLALTMSPKAAEDACLGLIDRKLAVSAPVPERSGAAGDTSVLDQVVDDRFREWSADWRTDRYLPGSARTSAIDCAGDRCNVSGAFSFTRGAERHTIPFTALLTRADSSNFALRRLCYQDITTGMSDCEEW